MPAPLTLTATNLGPRRKLAEITQRELGEKAGVHPRHVGLIENGDLKPKPVTLRRLERGFRAIERERERKPAWTGEKCRSEREAAGLSVRTLADLANVSPVTIITFENGTRRPYASVVESCGLLYAKHRSKIPWTPRLCVSAGLLFLRRWTSWRKRPR